MDTVQEETSPPPSPLPGTETQLFVLPPAPQIVVGNGERSRRNSYRRTSEHDSSYSNSRRPSTIIAALRRPSQVLALSAAHAVMNQRRYIMRLFNDHGDDPTEDLADPEYNKNKRINQEVGNDALSKILSALYGKLLVVLGMAFPITEIFSTQVKQYFYQGFYLYLYIGSISFVAYLFVAPLAERASMEMMSFYRKSKVEPVKKFPKRPPKFGSFYLRAGAIAFGIGSMVYSGLEFGLYFELRNSLDCNSNIIRAITPATRMVLGLVQVQFIFLNSKDFEYNQRRKLARFGLMHMVAANLCEWLYVLVEETKHEIIHLQEHSQNTTESTLGHKYCRENVMGSLLSNASPFLFPCTIEYSLICAVILYEMWKQVGIGHNEKTVKDKKKSKNPASSNRAENQLHFNPLGNRLLSSNHHYTIDCSKAHKGLFAGIMLIVLTIISLIMFFVLTTSDTRNESIAILEVNIVELLLYVLTTLAVMVAMMKMRNFRYDRKIGHDGSNKDGIGLDCTLLVLSQTGMFIYCMFSVIACYFTRTPVNDIEMVTEILAFIQTCIQTIFVLDSWWRRCSNIRQTRDKPGREIITFLIIANMTMWTINTLEKNRAEFRPSHLKFYGEWTWTIITHISMPLAVFYRFHSTICLFEIWKSAYKIKAKLQTQLFPLI